MLPALRRWAVLVATAMLLSHLSSDLLSQKVSPSTKGHFSRQIIAKRRPLCHPKMLRVGKVRAREEERDPMRFDSRRDMFIPQEQFIAKPRPGGNEFNRYSWDQSKNDVYLFLPVNETTTGKDIYMKLRSDHILVKCSDAIIFNETVAHDVDPYDTTWSFEEKGGQRQLMIQMEKKVKGLVWDQFRMGEDCPTQLTATDVGYLDFEIRKDIVDDTGKRIRRRKKMGRVVLGLFGKVHPELCHMFKAVLTKEAYSGMDKKSLTYNNSILDRIDQGNYIMGGALKDVKNGVGFDLPYGLGTHTDVESPIPLTGPGQLALVLDELNQVTSRFLISTGVDGINDTSIGTISIGRVLAGMDVVLEMEKLSQPDSDGRPAYHFTISSCGLLDPEEFSTVGLIPFCLQSSKFSTPKK